MVYFFIIARIILNPIANAFQKQLIRWDVQAEFVVFVTYLLLGLVSLGCLPLVGLQGLGIAFWGNIVLASAIDALGNLFSLKSLKTIDLSVFGPLNAYKPVMATVTAAVLLHEIPTVQGSIGIMVVIAGSYFINIQPNKKFASASLKAIIQSSGFYFRLLAIACYAVAVVFLKKAIIAASPTLTLLFWSIIGSLVLGVNLLLSVKRKELSKNYLILKNKWLTFCLLALLFSFSQWVSLFVFEKILLGYALAIFQLSAFIHILIGYRVFQEGNLRYKILGTIIMIAGALLIMLQ